MILPIKRPKLFLYSYPVDFCKFPNCSIALIEIRNLNISV